MNKQVIVVRTDLNMRKGKCVAQGAHASMAAILDHTGQVHDCDIVREWLRGDFTKIVVGVDSEEELKKIYVNTYKNMLPCSIITDNGKTEFNGVPTVTAVAVGPGPEEKIDEITGNLKLL